MRNEMDRRDETEVRHVELYSLASLSFVLCSTVQQSKQDGQEREGVPHSEHERFEGESASTIKA